MRVLIINGSPKGKYSVTVQSGEYLKKHNPNDEFKTFHVGRTIRKYEDDTVMGECIDAMADSDVIIFSYPVYTFLAPFQLARFIELLKQHPKAKSLYGKYATQITTSKHFYDTTAHRYINDNCGDLGLKTVTGLAADMDDLLTAQGRKQLKDFYKSIRFAVKNDVHNIQRTVAKPFEYAYQGKLDAVDNKDGFDTVMVTDSKDNLSLNGMIDAFKAVYPYPVREVNISDFPFKGGCLGCFECASDGKCVYKDGFEDLLRNEIQCADAIIFAASIKDHSMGPRFKCFDDRQFCNGHRVVTKGKVVGYILDGYLTEEKNLLDIIEARSEVSHMYLSGIATNESCDDLEASQSIKDFAKMTAFALENQLERPQNFFGIGGMKIFRDLIYVMRGLMKADHRFYKKHGVYDFPQKKKGTILKMQLLGMLMAIPSVRKKAKGKMNQAMIAPYKKAIDND